MRTKIIFFITLVLLIVSQGAYGDNLSEFRQPGIAYDEVGKLYTGTDEGTFEGGIKYKTSYKVIKGENHALLSASDALILASGTVALEAALYKTPMIIAYKGPFLFYLIYLLVRTIDKACLINIITGKNAVPEFLMYDATSKKIADKIIEILTDENIRNKQIEALIETKELLGDKHCVEVVAKKINEELTNG